MKRFHRWARVSASEDMPRKRDSRDAGEARRPVVGFSALEICRNAKTESLDERNCDDAVCGGGACRIP
jgi:hypothetical protein